MVAQGQGLGQLVVRGQILDVNSQRAVAYVNVVLKGTQLGSSSDAAGRFVLSVPAANSVLVFRHINYDVLELPAEVVLRVPQVYLQPRVIPLPAVEVLAPREPLAATGDLPLATAHLTRQEFDLRGFVDAGDLLHATQSVQVDEALSGRKTVSVRGGNADDVAVLYHGVKVNSAFDNVFDLSLVDLADVEKVELIKGSNAAFQGAGAFSGVINFVPRLEDDHSVRLFQRVGTYDAGTWGVAAYGRLGNASTMGNFRESGAKRRVQGLADGAGQLTNSSRALTLHGRYRLPPSLAAKAAPQLSALYLNVRSSYDDLRAGESFAQRSALVAFDYAGDVGAAHDLHLAIAHHVMDQAQEIAEATSWLHRAVADRTLRLQVEKAWFLTGAEVTFLYQREQDWLDFTDRRESPSWPASRPEEASVGRTHHGLVGVAHVHLPGSSEGMERVDFDLAVRTDHVHDRWHQTVVGERLALGTLSRSTLRFGTHFAGRHGQFAYEVFMNIGTNVRFPSLAQVISRARVDDQPRKMLPEENRSVEIGLSVARDLGVRTVTQGWEVAGGFFQNDYAHKIRQYLTPGMPLTLYDSVPTARIAGLEGRAAAYLLRKKLTVEAQSCHYFISERAAFPFHSETTRSLAFELEHAGYAVRAVWFGEGEQEGWIRDGAGGLARLTLPRRSDLDLHASKTWRLWRVHLTASLSVRNALNDQVVLQGLALRDRRSYLTGAVEY
ncbi:MAG: TonB-dependent receptor plug domain-containing protein [Candidatus Oleimicrobiaceae bacterium]